MENRTMEEDEAKATAKIVGLAALKYGDLSNQATKDYVFDIERFTSFEGNTGPYILYTIARINSILKKYAETCEAADEYVILPPTAEPEKTLMLALSKYSEVMLGSFEELAPHKICAYIYELSNALNHFYHETKIITEEDRAKQAGYIGLVSLTRDVLNTCIDILGFEAAERM
jgi:arginyl-tRNA synthetase